MEHDDDGVMIRKIAEATKENKLSKAVVISGIDYLKYADAYNDFMDENM